MHQHRVRHTLIQVQRYKVQAHVIELIVVVIYQEAIVDYAYLPAQPNKRQVVMNVAIQQIARRQVRTYRRDTLRLHQLITAVRHVIMRTVQKVATILQTVHSQVTISIMTKNQPMLMKQAVLQNGHIKQAVVRIQQIAGHTVYLM